MLLDSIAVSVANDCLAVITSFCHVCHGVCCIVIICSNRTCMLLCCDCIVLSCHRVMIAQLHNRFMCYHQQSERREGKLQFHWILLNMQFHHCSDVTDLHKSMRVIGTCYWTHHYSKSTLCYCIGRTLITIQILQVSEIILFLHSFHFSIFSNMLAC